MYSPELNKLLEKYKKDVYMKIKIENIISLYNSCNIPETRLVNELTVEFCRLIDLIEDNNREEMYYLESHYEDMMDEIKNQNTGFIPFKENQRHFENAINLENAFYRYFIENEYSELTVKDYFARVKTFSKKYINEIYSEQEIPIHPDERILFVYDNIEYIIAKFDVKEEKQRFNIRSALRKLNDFKKYQESK